MILSTALLPVYGFLITWCTVLVVLSVMLICGTIVNWSLQYAVKKLTRRTQ